MRKKTKHILTTSIMMGALFASSSLFGAEQKVSYSGIYPHIEIKNNNNECGIGAVVPFNGKLWAITYPPHTYVESADKLYEIDSGLNVTIRPESVGGTNANRLIHRETGKLIIGPYIISPDGKIDVINRRLMPGRLTGTARHLTDPANRVYIATMEEALYEVDVNTGKVGWLIRDGNLKSNYKIPAEQQGMLMPRPKGLEGTQAEKSELHGYHGKGLYSGQGKLFYANNGVRHENVDKDPTLDSGALAEWKGYQDRDWTLIRKNQFTEITSKGGIYGATSDKDPIWAMGWDYRSVLLGLLENGEWTYFRLPKGSHSYDGSHGWNTEWPRIREIGDKSEFLATMHGTFWKFPASFSLENRAGIRPRSNYLKIIGDFCEWNGRLVFGCDDSAKKEFFNTRPMKNEELTPGVSNSNLWFVEKSEIDKLGPVMGAGSVWLKDAVKKGDVSDPFLFAGYENRRLTLVNESDSETKVSIEIDKKGNGKWGEFAQKTIAPNESLFVDFKTSEEGEWIRIKSQGDSKSFTAHFAYSNADKRAAAPDAIFEGLAKGGAQVGACMGIPEADKLVLGVLAVKSEGGKSEEIGYYELDGSMKLVPAERPEFKKHLEKTKPDGRGIKISDLNVEVEEDGKTYLLPVNPDCDLSAFAAQRHSREVVTERDIFTAAGIFYELPARNSQGMAKVRAISSTPFAIQDYCSYRGMMLLSGLDAKALASQNSHIVKSADGKAALWAGAIDDLWKMGKPKGIAYISKEIDSKAGKISKQLLLRGFDKKTFTLSAKNNCALSVEIDIDGTGLWVEYAQVKLAADKKQELSLPGGFCGYWIRVKALTDAKALTVFAKFE